MKINNCCWDCYFYFDDKCIWATEKAAVLPSPFLTMGIIKTPKDGLKEKIAPINDLIHKLNETKPDWHDPIPTINIIQVNGEKISRNHIYCNCPAYKQKQ